MRELRIIGHIENDLPTKFGVPRQSGLAGDLEAEIVMEPEFCMAEAFRGLEDYSHIWLLWIFSETADKEWSPTVRPPRLGGNTRMGVFATRSPIRPNPIGLSVVKLNGITIDEDRGIVLRVSGADLMNGTPILDIKPYIPYVDAHPEALEGFTGKTRNYHLEVIFPEELERQIQPEKRAALREILSQDPRPGYHKDPEREYGMPYAGYDIGFKVKDQQLTVCRVSRPEPESVIPCMHNTKDH